MKKIFLLIMLLSTIVSAQPPEPVVSAVCNVQTTMQIFIAGMALMFAPVAVLAFMAGVYIYFKDKKGKDKGFVALAFVAAGILIPVFIALVYLMVPYIVASILGLSEPVECGGVELT